MAGDEDPTTTVPSFFRCPVSLELMKDPVTVASGITYDRSSIQKWLEAGHDTCPATMQVLKDKTLTPNYTLRLLIQSWAATNASGHPDMISNIGLDTDHEVQALLEDISLRGSLGLESLQKLRAKAKESARNCRYIMQRGGVPILLSILDSCGAMDWKSSCTSDVDCCEAIVGILALLPADNIIKQIMASSKNIRRVVWLLRSGNIDARINAALLLESLASERELKLLIGSTKGVFPGLVELLQASFSQMAIKASLRAIFSLCLSRRNRLRAVTAGAVHALLELLPDVSSITAENALAVLELLCRSAEGRAAFSRHAFGIPILSKKIISGPSDVAECAARILWTICKHAEGDKIPLQLLEEGVFAKLPVLLQMDSVNKHQLAQFLELLRSTRYSFDRQSDIYAV